MAARKTKKPGGKKPDVGQQRVAAVKARTTLERKGANVRRTLDKMGWGTFDTGRAHGPANRPTGRSFSAGKHPRDAKGRFKRK